jgi:hypothetical protein
VRRLDGVGDQRLAGKKFEVLARYALRPAAGGDEAECAWALQQLEVGAGLQTGPGTA